MGVKGGQGKAILARRRWWAMAGSVNKVILVGNLGRDPEVRLTQANQKIVHLAIATSERWKDRLSGETRERTEWHRVVIFNEQLADIAERYLRKGSPVYLKGTLQTRKWTDQGGQERYTTEVVVPRFRGELTLLGGRGEGGGTEIGSPEDFDSATGTGYRSPAPGGGGREWPPSLAEQLDDDIPF
jgi:single-strand DNA-binding protein